MGRMTLFGFDATDPDEGQDSGGEAMQSDPRIEISHKFVSRGPDRGSKVTWDRGHSVSEHLWRGYDAMVAACKREFARYENNDDDENLNGEADCDDGTSRQI